MVCAGAGNRQRAAVEESENADGRHRNPDLAAQRAERERHAPVHHRGPDRRRRRAAHEIPLPRPAARLRAQESGAAPQDDDSHPQFPRLARFHRGGNADSDWFHARGSPRLRGALAHESRPVLRPAAVAADAEAVAHGQRLRPLFPDCKMLPRRRPASRPPA